MYRLFIAKIIPGRRPEIVEHKAQLLLRQVALR